MDIDAIKRDYGPAIARRQERQKRIQRTMIWISVISFGGSTVFGFGKIFKGFFEQPQQTQAAEQNSATSILEKQERGYEAVLKREPNNLVALEGLVNIRLQQNDVKGAIEPLEMLVKLNPQREEYKTLLGQLKQL